MIVEERSVNATTDRAPATLRQRVWIFLLMILWSAWWGGLTFYAVVVVPIGTEAIGSVGQGFITQRVTYGHNALTGLFVVTLLIEAYRRRSRSLAIIASVLSLILIALIAWHVRLTGMMDFESRRVPGSFYAEHAVYLWITAAEWGLGMLLPLLLFPMAIGDNSKSSSK